MSSSDDYLVRCACECARFEGAEAGLVAVDNLVIDDDSDAQRVVDGEKDFEPPVLSDRCDVLPNIHDLMHHAGSKGLALTSRDRHASIQAALTAAWKDGRDAVWASAVQEKALRLLGRGEEARRIKEANETYVSVIRSRFR